MGVQRNRNSILFGSNNFHYKEVEAVSVGENINRLRREKDLTQAYVAEKAGISQAMLCQIERGTKNPSIQIGKEIADVLGCSLDYLLTDAI